MPLGSQWCCSAASACMGRPRACVSWTTPSCCRGSSSSVLWVMYVDSIRVCHALRRSSEMALISSSPNVMVLSAKGSSSYFSRYSLISSMDSGVRPGTFFYTHEECYFGRFFVGRSRTGHSIRLWRELFSTASSS